MRVRVRVRLVGEVGAGTTALGNAVVVVLAAGLLIANGLVGANGQELLAIGVRGALVATALGLAAADGEEPEEAGGERKGSAEPDDGEEGLVDFGVGAVLAQGTLDSTDNNESQSGHHGRSGNDGSGGDERHEPSDAGDGTGAGGEDAHNKLEGESNAGNDEDDLRPLGDRLESVQALLKLLGDSDVDASKLVELGKSLCVELVLGPVELGLGAVVDTIKPVGAIAPDGDLVGLCEPKLLGSDVVGGSRGTAGGAETEALDQ